MQHFPTPLQSPEDVSDTGLHHSNVPTSLGSSTLTFVTDRRSDQVLSGELDEKHRNDAKADWLMSTGRVAAAVLVAGILLLAGLCTAGWHHSPVPNTFKSHSTPAESLRHAFNEGACWRSILSGISN